MSGSASGTSTFLTIWDAVAPSVCAVSTYRSGTVAIAAAASEYTNGTHAMKMNITFCASSIPNHKIVSGISAATGRLRPNSASGAPAASTTRHDPAMTPSGTPTAAARPNPMSTRFRVAAMLWTSARSCSRLGKLCTTSAGLGRMTGEISRSSAPRPVVTSHQRSTTPPIVPTPTRRRVIRDGDSRSAKSDGFARIYLGAAVASAG